MDTKKPWQSKTVVINAILGVVAALSLFWPAAAGVPTWIQSHAEIIGAGWAILNVGLRLITKDAISLTD